MKRKLLFALALLAVLAQGCKSHISPGIGDDDGYKPLEEYSQQGIYSVKSSKAKPLYTFDESSVQRAIGNTSSTRRFVRYMDLGKGKLLTVNVPTTVGVGTSVSITLSSDGISELTPSSITSSATLSSMVSSLYYFTDDNYSYAYIIKLD